MSKIGNPAAALIAADTFNKQDKYVKYTIIAVIVIAILWVIYRINSAFNFITNPFGVTDMISDWNETRQENRSKVEANLVNDAFSTSFWRETQSNRPHMVYDTVLSSQLASDLNDSMSSISSFLTDSTRIKSIIRDAPTVADVSAISNQYRSAFNANLYDELRSALSTSDFATVLRIIEAKQPRREPVRDANGFLLMGYREITPNLSGALPQKNFNYQTF